MLFDVIETGFLEEENCLQNLKVWNKENHICHLKIVEIC